MAASLSQADDRPVYLQSITGCLEAASTTALIATDCDRATPLFIDGNTIRSEMGLCMTLTTSPCGYKMGQDRVTFAECDPANTTQTWEVPEHGGMGFLKSGGLAVTDTFSEVCATPELSDALPFSIKPAFDPKLKTIYNVSNTVTGRGLSWNFALVDGAQPISFIDGRNGMAVVYTEGYYLDINGFAGFVYKPYWFQASRVLISPLMDRRFRILLSDGRCVVDGGNPHPERGSCAGANAIWVVENTDQNLGE